MILSEASFGVLALCTSRPGNPAIGDRLRGALANVGSWATLVADAEEHGLEPLLLAHAREHGIDLPHEMETRLKVRCMQHAHAAAVRTRAIAKVLDALDADGIPALILKGGALAHLVYPSPALRPMRDIDLLVPVDRATAAWESLRRAGLSPAGKRQPDGYHHLQELAWTADGATMTVEIHKEMLRATPFVRPARYAQLAERSQAFAYGGRPARTLGPEDMLWHIYAHAFVINVLRPGIRLISIADLIAATETWVERIDWDRLRSAYPRLIRALPRIGQIVPWSARVEREVGAAARRGAVTARGVSSAVRWHAALSPRIWWPPEWWLDVRYGVDGGARRMWTRLVTHPACVMLAAADTARRRYHDAGL
jgi:hypothetical protein